MNQDVSQLASGLLAFMMPFAYGMMVNLL